MKTAFKKICVTFLQLYTCKENPDDYVVASQTTVTRMKTNKNEGKKKKKEKEKEKRGERDEDAEQPRPPPQHFCNETMKLSKNPSFKKDHIMLKVLLF